MKILGICGSPREGNTEVMLREVLRGAEAQGADVELVLLRKLDIRRCTGCDACKTGECPIKDDVEGVFEKIFASDVVVLGSPNYFNNVPGLMKDFMDRSDPWWQDKRLKGKKAAAVCVGSVEPDSPKRVLQEYTEILQMDLIKSVSAVVDGRGEISGNKKKMQECFELGKWLAKL